MWDIHVFFKSPGEVQKHELMNGWPSIDYRRIPDSRWKIWSSVMYIVYAINRCREILRRWHYNNVSLHRWIVKLFQRSLLLFLLMVGWFLWHIKHYRLFTAKCHIPETGGWASYPSADMKSVVSSRGWLGYRLIESDCQIKKCEVKTSISFALLDLFTKKMQSHLKICSQHSELYHTILYSIDC